MDKQHQPLKSYGFYLDLLKTQTTEQRQDQQKNGDPPPTSSPCPLLTPPPRPKQNTIQPSRKAILKTIQKYVDFARQQGIVDVDPNPKKRRRSSSACGRLVTIPIFLFHFPTYSPISK